MVHCTRVAVFALLLALFLANLLSVIARFDNAFILDSSETTGAEPGHKRPGVQINYGDVGDKQEALNLDETMPLQRLEDGIAVFTKQTSKRVPVSTVAFLTFVMASATGLGAVPFFFMDLQAQWAGICNGVAAGVMLAASFDLVQEGQIYGGGTWVVLGILAGGFFIHCCQKFLERYGEVSMLDIKGADARKMMLVIGIMTLHSFGEGSGVGVSFAGPRGLSKGMLVTFAIAVHNIPEGLAVSMVLASRGVSARSAMLWSVFTSMPQALVGVPAFMCAEAFQKFLPSCMGFAAGCMIWMVLAEVVPDSFKESSPQQVASAAIISVSFMEALSTVMEALDHGPRWETMMAFVVSLLFGLGPFIGGLVLAAIGGAIKFSQSFLTGTSAGVAFVLVVWRPLQLWLGGKMHPLIILGLLLAGFSFYYAIKLTLQRHFHKFAGSEIISLPSVRLVSPISMKAYLASGAVGLHAFAEGLALGVAAPKAYGLGRHMLLPVSLHGLPRGVAVTGSVYGATGSWQGAVLAAGFTGFAGPLAAIGAILAGIDYSGLDRWMVFGCGALIPAFGGDLLKRAFKLSLARTVCGLIMGFCFTNICLACTRLVCLHTPYCNSAPEAVT
eukprot:c26511_g2_i1 orf=228-2066(-)